MKCRKFVTAGALCLAVVLIAGCRGEEQNRITNYEPGVYKGKPDQSLSAEMERELQRRALLQAGSTGTGGGGGGPKSRDVRKPATPGIDMDKLNTRTRNQKGS